jgi:RHS repeat-associated protein
MIGRSIFWLAPLALLASVASCAPAGAPDSTVTVRSALDSTVVVTVRDGAGVPLAGIEVMAVKSNGSIQGYADTNASGQATMSLPANSYRFLVNEDGSDFYSGAVGHCVTPACTTAQITLTRVDVTVVDTSGAPLVGHLIWWESSQGDDGGYVETAANGHAIIATPAGSYRFVDYVNGYDFTSGAAGHCIVPSCTAVTITETIPVAVTVTNTLGTPQPNVTVAWQDQQGNEDGWIDTNASGVALLSVPPGSYRFLANVSGSEFVSGPANHCVVPGCTSASIAVSAPVSVTVTDTAGAPIVGKVVSWVNAGGDTGNGTQTNASGVSSVVPPPEAVRFRVTVDNTQFFSGQSVHCSQPGCTSATITVSEPTVVTVVDGAGAPISGRAVTLLFNDGTTNGNKTTNTSGQATFRLPFGQWRFRATCSGTSEQFFSGNAGHCFIPGGCLTAKIKMPCGQCTGQSNGTSCNDQNPCTGSSTCQSQKCTGANPTSCSASDQCHDVGACGAEAGTCSNPPKANGSSCNDNNACTGSSSCQAGVCTGANPVTCTASDQCHAAGTCNPATGVCSNPEKANGTPCTDNNLCTQTDTCQLGACVSGSPVVCTAQDQCHVAGTCSPGTGLCSNPAKPDGTTCSDNQVCTQTETCQAGSCQGPSPVQAPTILNLAVEHIGHLGGNYAIPSDINAAGEIVGGGYTASSEYHAFSKSPGGPIVDLGLGLPSTALALNDSGVLVGRITAADGPHAFRYSASGGLHDFGLIGDGSTYNDYFGPGPTDVIPLRGSRAYDINAQGQVVGDFTNGGMLHGFRYTDGTGFEDIGSLAGGATYAFAINESGMVGGNSWVPGTPLTNDVRRFGHAVIFQDAIVGLVDLNDLIDPLLGWNLHSVVDMAGDFIVGTGERNGVLRAFRFRLSTGVIDDLWGGFEGRSSGAGVNSHGDVVGLGEPDLAGTYLAAFVYSDSFGFKNLNDMIDPASGWNLRTTSAINDSGDIVGWGHLGGNVSAYHVKLPSGHALYCGQRTTCGGDSDAVCLFSEGVVETSPGNFVAVFGYDNASTTSVHPATNQVHINGSLQANPQPPPPADLAPGIHSGAYLAQFGSGQTISWTVNGETVTATASSPSLSGTEIIVSLAGIADDSAGVTKAIFTYATTSAVDISIPYGPNDNSLSNESGFVAAPPEMPPQVFASRPHSPFAATLGTQLTWTVRTRSATATTASPRLPTTTGPGGSRLVTMPDGSKFNLDTVVPKDPTPTADPVVGDEFPGALSGQLSVSPSGAATYTVPIAIPPGVSGMAPNLSLVYNSQSGDGIAGQGWDLGGLSMIHRCPKTKAVDGVMRPILMDDLGSGNQDQTDGLCLDGMHLFEDPVGSGKYRSEKQTFGTIEQLTDGSFRVTTKSGEVRSYGSKLSSQIDIFGTGSGHPFEVAVWGLDRVVDVWGNFYEVVYNNDVAFVAPTEGFKVTAIRYTGHASNTQPPPNTITFQYEPRNDVRWIRFAGTRIPKNRRLTAIVTPRGQYTLTYRPNTGTGTAMLLPSILDKIDYSAGGKSLKPLEFGWTTGSYTWQERPAFALPALVPLGKQLKGIQFPDLDGDGRADLVLARDGTSTESSHRITWTNTGAGWQIRGVNWWLPTTLTDSTGALKGAQFADVDGDGQVDIIQDRVDLTCVTPTNCFVCTTEPGQGACSGTITHASPAVWLNRFGPGQGQNWELHREYENTSAFGDLRFRPIGAVGTSFVDTVADIDGDKLPDIVRIQGFENVSVSVLLNQGVGQPWLRLPTVALFGGIPPIGSGPNAHLEDVNRDGLPDIVAANHRRYSDGHLEADVAVWINKGVANLATGSRISFHSARITNGTPGGTPTALQNPPSFGDIDGDGAHDAALLYAANGDTFCGDVSCVGGASPRTGVGLGDGSGVAYSGANAAPYAQALTALAPRPLVGENVMLPDFGFALVDVNADGLVDLVRNHAQRGAGELHPGPGGGQLLVNTGTTWKDLFGVDTWQVSPGESPVPRTPDYIYVNDGSAFVDLDGDGLSDLITESPETHAWVNTFQSPVINQFPNQLAFRTIVSYVSLTSAAARSGASPTYTETGVVDPGTKRLVLPMRVVQSLSVDSAVGGAANVQTFQYSDMRVSAADYGPQGFKTMTVTDATGLSTKTTFAQVYPYTGLPIMVERSNGGPVTTTKTIYCTTNAFDDGDDCAGPFVNRPGTGPRSARSTFFPRPAWVEDVTYLRSSTYPEPSPPLALTVTTFTYDDRGNPTTTDVNSQGLGENYSTITQNEYGAAGSLEQRLGKVTRSAVTTRRNLPQGPPITHTTEFQYQTFFGALAMSKKKVEAGAGAPIELHTSYDYDKFGNVVTTTSCASNFSDCSAGATGPSELPFRTTRVSFNSADFNRPTAAGLISALPYGDGRFPVMTTNALGQKEYSAYDPLLGAVRQKTGPNGIHTCYEYDSLGNQTAETARCGSAAPITTTTSRFYAVAAPASPALSKVVTVTRPPVGSPTWTYSDALGRVIATRTRHFDGGLIETGRSYDVLGRLASESKPHRLGDTVFASVSTYDPLGRISTVTQDIGSLDATSSPTSTTATTTYAVGATTVTHVVGGATQTRTETKNVVGKVIEVKDTDLQTITYAYDADGNLKDTFDPAGNVVHVDYDIRGRKTSSTDPDLGTWSYGYNGFGDLVSQTDAKAQTTTMAYDRLGRMTSSTDAAGTAQWVYDVAPGAGVGKLAAMISAPDDAKLNAPCVVPFVSVTGGNRAGRTIRYTQFGDVEEESQCTDGEPFRTSFDYDVFGRPSVVRYPSINGQRLAIESHYTSLGHLQYVTDLGDGSVLWVAKSMNALGQVTKEILKNGVETTANRNSATGWLLGSDSVAHADSDKLIQKWDYGYDEVGNLRRRDRSDAVITASTEEVFTYDGLNRLKTSTVETSDGFTRNEQFFYNPIGNITIKNGQQYFYDTGCTAGTRPAGPHAVCSVQGGSSYQYDGNGNMISGGSRSVTYNSSNKPTTIQSFSPTTSTVDFAYGADTHRVLQIATTGTQTARTVYVGLGGTGKSLYERTIGNGTTQHAQFIYAQGSHGGAAFAIRVTTEVGSSTTAATKYYHFDHLGSVTAMSDELGRVVAGSADATVMNYDAWGLRRDPDGRPASGSFNQQAGRREFTGHETITGVGLINMNGRVYDPVLGRFLSADPQIQFVADLQSFNRYSYVHNNPLSYTDPTGFGLFAMYGVDGWLDTALTIGVTVVGVAVCAVSAGAGCAALGAFIAYQSAFSVGVEALQAGATPWQAVGLMSVSAVAGFAGGAAGSAAGGGLVGAVVSGAVSGALSAGLTTAIMGGRDLGRNILIGAGIGAASGAVAWGFSTGLKDLTQANVAAAQGRGRVASNRPVVCGGEYLCGTEADETGEGIDLDKKAREFYRSRSPVGRKDENIGDTTVRLKREHITTLYEDPSGRFRRDPTTVGARGDETPVFRWRLKTKGESISAFAHSHFDIPGSNHLSDVDIATAIKYDARIYMLPPGGNYIEVFEPAQPWQGLPKGIKGTIYTIPGL